ncbi:hypothetical protein D3C72_1632500 [compost metagenome]
MLRLSSSPAADVRAEIASKPTNGSTAIKSSESSATSGSRPVAIRVKRFCSA